MTALPPSKIAEAFLGLTGSRGQDERLRRVEALMHRLARGGRVDRTGAMAIEQLDSGGKRFRARLALQACQALGVADRDAECWAAALELLHNATLVHDDIQDEDTTRRGAPTLWVKHGIAQAINAGDFMLMLPFLALGEMPSERRGELCLVLAEYATRIVRGQMEELGLRSGGRLDWENYVSAAAGKTGALIALPVLGAAILAGRSRAQADRLADLFVQAGVLFQIQDDVVDLFGKKGRAEVGGDIYEGKISALVVAQLELEPESRAQVLRILDRPRSSTTPQDVSSMQETFVESGALHAVLDRLSVMRQEILDAPDLAAEPSLRFVTEQLLHRALEPVSHLLALLGEGQGSANEVIA